MDELNPTTLEDLLRMEVDVRACNGEMIKMTPEFRVTVQRKKDDRIHFMIHPQGYDGETLDFVVQGNELKHLVESVNGKAFQKKDIPIPQNAAYKPGAVFTGPNRGEGRLGN